MESAPKVAHPSAKASSTTPVRTFSVGGVNGAATKTAATTRPATIDVATIAPSLLLAVGGGSGWRSLCWVRVIVTASPRASDLQSQARTACTSAKTNVHVWRLGRFIRGQAPLASRPSPCSRYERRCRPVGGLVAPAAPVSAPGAGGGGGAGEGRTPCTRTDDFRIGAATLPARRVVRLWTDADERTALAGRPWLMF